MMTKLTVFKIDDGETWWIAASDREDAIEQARKDYHIGEDYETIEDWMNFTDIEPLREGESLKVNYDSDDVEDVHKPFAMRTDYNRVAITMTCKQWCEVEGRGLLAATVY